MKIINNMGHTCYFPYAGSGRRGVNLRSQEQSPELPVERANHPSLRSDLRRKRIRVLLSPSDKATLRTLVDDETMEMLEVSKAGDKPKDEPPTGKQMDPQLPEAGDHDSSQPDAVYESKREQDNSSTDSEPEDKANAVKEELESRISMMQEAGKLNTLERLSQSSDPATAKAASELLEELNQSADPAGSEESSDTSKDAQDSDNESEQNADPNGTDSGESSNEPRAKEYKGIKKAELLSECLRRELPANPTMKNRELREMLMEDDKQNTAESE